MHTHRNSLPAYYLGQTTRTKTSSGSLKTALPFWSLVMSRTSIWPQDSHGIRGKCTIFLKAKCVQLGRELGNIQGDGWKVMKHFKRQFWVTAEGIISVSLSVPRHYAPSLVQTFDLDLDPNTKGSKECLFIMTQIHNLQIFWVIPFDRLSTKRHFKKQLSRRWRVTARPELTPKNEINYKTTFKKTFK